MIWIFFFSFQFYRFLLHELWSSVVRCIHKTIMFLVILTHLLFNVPLCSSFGDLVLLSSPAASFSNCPTGERSYWICQALLYLVHLLTRILWQLPHEQLLICVLNPGTITCIQNMNEILCCKPWWSVFQELLHSAFSEGDFDYSSNHIITFIMTLQNWVYLCGLLLYTYNFNHITQFYKRICKPRCS